MLRQALAEIIASEVKDPAVRQITLTDVEVTGDLREARIYFSHHGDDSETSEILKGLQRSAGFLRRQLGQKISMRTTPSLEFRLDSSLAYGARIEAVFKSIESNSDGNADEDT